MKVVGVDFGTTNVRIATWNSDEPDVIPQPVLIGQGDAPNMPAVIAFQRQTGGVRPIVGEGADGLDDDEDTVVVRNVKRWALSGDPFVKWNLETSPMPRPAWWNPDTRCVEAFEEVFPVWEVIRQILAEAFQRASQAGLDGEFEWRAGCPVHAGLDYRTELARALSEFGGDNKVTSVVEEPALFLVLVQRLETLQPGSYLVYDLGGGSFDCALAVVETDGQMTVYASSGAPLLGGANIDEILAKQMGYAKSPSLLRIAKEQLTPSGPALVVDDNISLSWADLEDTLKKAMFLEHTLVPMREAYISAKVIWKRDEQAATIGNSSIPSLRLGDMPAAFARDLDAIILTGGPTKSPFFRERLAERFGSEKVRTTPDLVPTEIPDPELTGLSIGACYAAAENHSPLYVRRLPARVTLRNTTTGNEVGYEPYQHFVPNFSPAFPFVSNSLPPSGANAKYRITISDPDGTTLRSQMVNPEHLSNSQAREGNLKLVIDTLGRIGIDHNGIRRVVMDDTPWQTGRQREILRSIVERQRAAEASERERTHRLLWDNPFGWQSVPG